ncbi:MAG TPA: hypothetical protein PKA06_13240, partial [Gemmatales bacterium]|nr:hypothetical protein [Gemmatales bacterium]
MNRLFQPPQDQNTSKRLCSVESVSRHRQKWEQAIRETAARKLWEKESEISIWAVDTHCELHPEINSPKGSLRRKKGYEDGRHLVRAIGNCVRSNDLSPLSQEILSWFAIGDPAMRVTAQDVEFFVTFVHQGCRRSLGSKDLYMTDELMESAKALCRQAGSCWDLRTHATAIAETAYSLLLQQAPSLNHVSQSWVQPGQVHDDEKFLLALSDILNRHAYDALQHVTRWLLENQLLHVDYPLEYWNARLT